MPKKQQKCRRDVHGRKVAGAAGLKAPSARDQRAFRLSSLGWSQRKIAAKLGCSQPTVLRGILRASLWSARTLPSDRGEMTDAEKFTVACQRHEIFLAAVQRRAMRDYCRSGRSVPVKKKITRNRKVSDDGSFAETRVEEYEKHQVHRKSLLDAATKASHERTVLAAGYLGPNGSIACDKPIDTAERRWWDEALGSRTRLIEKLQQEIAELKTEVEQCRLSLRERAVFRATGVSPSAESEPTLYQGVNQNVATTSGGAATCTNPPDTDSAAQKAAGKAYQSSSECGAWSARSASGGSGETSATPKRQTVETTSPEVPLAERADHQADPAEDGRRFLAEVKEVLDSFEPVNDCDMRYKQLLKRLYQNCSYNLEKRGIIPVRQRLPRLEGVRLGRPYFLIVPEKDEPIPPRQPEPWEYGEEVNTYRGDYIVSGPGKRKSRSEEDDDEKARQALRRRMQQLKKK